MNFKKYVLIMSVVLVATQLCAFAGMAADKPEGSSRSSHVERESGEASGFAAGIVGEAPDLDLSEGEASVEGNALSVEASVEGNSLGVEAEADGEAMTLEAAYRTQDQIRAYVKAHPFDYPAASYVTEPVITAPYAPGKLDPSVLQNAVTELNVLRYVAGVSDNVVLVDENEEMAQAAAMISAAKGTINHYPTQPDDMDKELFDAAYAGCSSSNLAAGFYTLGSAVLDAWLGDSGVAGVGHRWWALHPGLYGTAFGWVKNPSSAYRNFYSMDVIHSNVTSKKLKGVVWPARNMPVEYFDAGTPWSITVSYPSYSNQQENQPDAVVTLTRRGDGKVWTFSAADQSDGTFEPATSNNTLVFYPNSISYKDGDVFDVKVENLTGSRTLEYTVNFFKLETSGSDTSSSSSKTSTSTAKGGTTSTAKGGTTSTAKGGTTSTAKGGTTSAAKGGTTSTAKGGTTSTAKGGTTSTTKTSSSSTSGSDTRKTSSSSTGASGSDTRKTSSSSTGGSDTTKTGSSSTSKSGTTSSSSSSSDSTANTPGYKKITQAKGDTLVVGQKGYLSIPGVKNKDVIVKGKLGTYSNGVVYSDRRGVIKLAAPVEKGAKTKLLNVCTIKVEEPKLKKKLSLKNGISKQLNLNGTKTQADRWVSSKPSVAKVSSTGLVTAVNSGECQITAYIGDYRCECLVIVK